MLSYPLFLRLPWRIFSIWPYDMFVGAELRKVTPLQIDVSDLLRCTFGILLAMIEYLYWHIKNLTDKNHLYLTSEIRIPMDLEIKEIWPM